MIPAGAATRVFRAFNPDKEVSPKDAEWVDFDAYRDRPVLQPIAQDIGDSEPGASLVRLLSGGRGVGKSSALRALKQQLEEGVNGQRFHVTLIDTDDLLDLNDCSAADLLILITGTVLGELRDRKLAGQGPAESAYDYLTNSVLNIADFEVEGVEAFGVKFKRGFQKKRSAIKEARDRIDALRTDIVFRFKDVLHQVNLKLGDHGLGGLVVIVDGTDKIVNRLVTVSEDGLQYEVDQQKRALVEPASLWTDLGCHLVLTLPNSLAYSDDVRPLELQARTRLLSMPLVPLCHRADGEISESAKGYQMMEALIQNRCQIAGLQVADVFESNEVRHRLIKLSGGHPAELMRFVRSARGSGDSLPITADALKRAVEDETDALFQRIPKSYWPVLRSFGTSQTAVDQEDERIRKSLFYMYIFHYKNGESWYEVNPVLRESRGFHTT